jgi:peptidyl-prolyl cis-trans isomerase-like 3
VEDKLNFLCLVVNNLLLFTDLKYTVFGRVLDGWDTLDQLEKLPTNPKNHKPLPGKEARVTSVTIHANPLAG